MYTAKSWHSQINKHFRKDTADGVREGERGAGVSILVKSLGDRYNILCCLTTSGNKGRSCLATEAVKETLDLLPGQRLRKLLAPKHSLRPGDAFILVHALKKKKKKRTRDLKSKISCENPDFQLL